VTPWPTTGQRLSRTDLLRVDSLVVLARNVRAALDDRFGERSTDALYALDQLVAHAARLRPQIATRVTGDEPDPLDFGAVTA
jgi:hypothetical protein